jgi:hypothetical protein
MILEERISTQVSSDPAVDAALTAALRRSRDDAFRMNAAARETQYGMGI